MQTNYEIFILVAEEMSISGASKRAFVSQQCVSDHIKRIEQQYGLLFFTRKPRFQLTPAGESLLQSLYKIKSIESMMQKDMTQRLLGETGSFTMGINASRAQVVLPWVLPDYNKDFPDVEISFLMDDTIGLEEKLLQGKIDLFFGVNTHYNKDFDYIHLFEDRICLVVSEGLLKKRFNDREYAHILSKGDLRYFEDILFSRSYITGAINHLLKNHLDSNNLKLQTPYRISDIDTQISLCAKGLCAMFCPQMLLAKIPIHNENCSKEEYIHILPIEGFNESLRLDLVSLKHIEKPNYIKAFQNKLFDAVKKHLDKKN
jgi:DNA-binding transcriptional LysR family regulator